ncbi:hypothetical protein [Streptomyces roseirectus]|nr:hypothetical protein [Streptomyces roseirectus]
MAALILVGVILVGVCVMFESDYSDDSDDSGDFGNHHGHRT